MFRTILWATDGSETAARALPFALELAEGHEATLVVAHAREIFVGRGGGYPVLADEGELRDKIGRQVEELRSGGLDAKFVVRTCTSGHAATAITEIAKEVGADLIVVGSRGVGDTPLGELGSTSGKIVRRSSRPVLVVPHP